jgi:hypothetical protein
MKDFRTTNVPAEIRTKNVSNTSLELCHYSSLLGDVDVELLNAVYSTDILSEHLQDRWPAVQVSNRVPVTN